jgi:hypothetical protein
MKPFKADEILFLITLPIMAIIVGFSSYKIIPDMVTLFSTTLVWLFQ